MRKKHSTKEIQRVKDFFNRDNVYKQLKTMVSFLIPHRSDVTLKLNIGGGSHTNGKSITVGLPEMFIGRSYGEIFTVLRALVGHEAQHVNSSDFEHFKKYIKDTTEYFKKKYPELNNHFGQAYLEKVSHHFGNSVEDGRIEKILGQKFRGYVKYLKFMNISLWEGQPMQGNSELEDFMYSVTSYCVTGLEPKDFKKFYEGTDLEINLNKIKPMILVGIDKRTFKECMDKTIEIIEAVEPYLVSLLINRTKETEDFLNNMDSTPEFTTSEETEHNDSPSTVITHFVPKEKPEQKDEEKESSDDEGNSSKEEEKESEGKGADSKEKSEEDKEKEDEKSSSSNNSESEEDESNEAEGKGSSDNQTSEEEENEDDNGSGGSSNDEENAENEEESGNEKNDSEGDSEEDPKGKSDENSNEESDSDDESANSDKDSDDEKNSSKNELKNKEDENKQADHNPKGMDEKSPEEVNEEEVADFLRSLTKEVEDEANQKISQSKEAKVKEKLKAEDFKLNPDELKEIEMIYRNDSNKHFQEIEGLKLSYHLPADIKREGSRFRKDVERIFRNKEEYTLRGQRKGILDVGNLHKLRTKEVNVFVKKGVPVKSDFVGFLLEDGSGSMSEKGKWESSKRALAVMEEGLKGIIPFKIATFNTDYYGNSVLHHLVKDFKEENKTYNYSYNSFEQRRAGGGNKDGYSIRIATKELLKRPEKDRILIILSDGLPSDYRNGRDAGMVDVKEAVKEARKAGIFVVALLFGSESFRDMNIESYKYMYEKNIISCDAEMIGNHLVRMLKKVIAH